MKKYLSLYAFCFLLLLSACGYKTFPSPSINQNELFSWHNLDSSIINNTLSISGQVLGNVNNLSSITVEVQALDEDCAACPFVSEFSEVFYTNEILEANSTVFIINYALLNKDAEEYRWRIIGKNYKFGIENIISPVYITTK